MIIASLAAHAPERTIYGPDPSPDAPFLTLDSRGFGKIDYDIFSKANVNLLNPL